jgi:hypothetical protein
MCIYQLNPISQLTLPRKQKSVSKSLTIYSKLATTNNLKSDNNHNNNNNNKKDGRPSNQN